MGSKLFRGVAACAEQGARSGWEPAAGGDVVPTGTLVLAGRGADFTSGARRSRKMRAPANEECRDRELLGKGACEVPGNRMGGIGQKMEGVPAGLTKQGLASQGARTSHNSPQAFPLSGFSSCFFFFPSPPLSFFMATRTAHALFEAPLGALLAV
jgi:hypothetical protein